MDSGCVQQRLYPAHERSLRLLFSFPECGHRPTSRPPPPQSKPALSNRNIEICQWVMPGNDVPISSVESGLAEASRPR
jgi:hypothetical protein